MVISAFDVCAVRQLQIWHHTIVCRTRAFLPSHTHENVAHRGHRATSYDFYREDYSIKTVEQMRGKKETE